MYICRREERVALCTVDTAFARVLVIDRNDIVLVKVTRVAAKNRWHKMR